MEKLYDEISEELLVSLENYSLGRTSYEELRTSFLKEELAYKHPSWDSLEKATREEIFHFEKNLFSHLRDVEAKLKNIEKEKMKQDKQDDLFLDLDGLVSHSRMISRNKMPSESYSNSIWYLPFCPNHNNIESLYEE